MGKKSRRSRRSDSGWSEPFAPTPTPGQKYAVIPVGGGRALTVNEEHAAEMGSVIVDSLNLTDRILVKWNVIMASQLHLGDQPLMHRAVCASFNNPPPAHTPASHPLAEKIDQFKTLPEIGGFVRHKDGDTANNNAINLEFVTLKDAMAHYDDWIVDHDFLLTEEESALVADPVWRNALVF